MIIRKRMPAYLTLPAKGKMIKPEQNPDAK
jgi:hypothetical protein